MGLLDGLGQSGQGGLLDMLMYRSPLLRGQPEAQTPQFDPMGGFTGFMTPPQFSSAPTAPAFPAPLPQAAPAASVDMADLSRRMGFPQQAPVQQTPPAMQPPQPPSQARPAQPEGPGTIAIGGYQMPRIGSVADFTPDPASIPVNATPTQGQMPAGPTAAPSFMGSQDVGIGDRLSAALQNFANAGGVLPALAGGVSGLVSGNRTDAVGTTQQNQRAQFAALSPILGPQKAMLAVMNPEAGKILLAQALDKQTPKFGVVRKDADGREVYGFVNERNQSVNEYGNAGAGPSETVTGPDGKPIPIPQGVDRKAFVGEVSRAAGKAAAGDKTEVQAKSEKFGNKMELAESNIKNLQGQGLSLMGKIASGVPLGNYAQSQEFQRYDQAKNNFITSLLRDESGAAIGTQEFQRYERELFPQPGDSPEVMAQKAEARKVAIEGMKKAAGPGYKSIPEAPSSGIPAGWSVKAR